MLGALPLLAATINADTLVLRDGRRVQGQLITFRDGVVEFQEGFSRGRVLRLDRNDVLGVELDRYDRNDRNDRNDRDQFGNPPQPQPVAGRPRGLREKQLMAPAATAWSDTGIHVNSGQTVYFEAVGEIRWGPNRRAGPSGEANSPNNAARPMPNRSGASLIGRVGESQDLFFIGDDKEGIRMRSSGRLYVGINDDNLQDNTGYFRVIVYY
jgi:hypothetical protein